MIIIFDMDSTHDISLFKSSEKFIKPIISPLLTKKMFNQDEGKI